MENIQFEEKGRFYEVFNKAAIFLESFAFVLILILSLTVFQIIETSTLLIRVLPIESKILRIIASISLANAIEFTQLKFTIHQDKIGKYTPLFLAFASLCLNIFFFEAWTDTNGHSINELFNNSPVIFNNEELSKPEYTIELSSILIKTFFSMFIAFLTYKYADLYIKKRQENFLHLSIEGLTTLFIKKKDDVKDLDSKKTEMKLLTNRVNQVKLGLAQKNKTLNELNTKVNQRELKVNALNKVINQQELSINLILNEVEELKTGHKKITTYAEKFQCPKCLKPFSTIQKKDNHITICNAENLTTSF